MHNKTEFLMFLVANINRYNEEYIEAFTKSCLGSGINQNVPLSINLWTSVVYTQGLSSIIPSKWAQFLRQACFILHVNQGM